MWPGFSKHLLTCKFTHVYEMTKQTGYQFKYKAYKYLFIGMKNLQNKEYLISRFTCIANSC